MLYYLLQVLVLQFIFLLFYRWFLRKETFFQWNRFYLMATAVLSLIIPRINLGWLQRDNGWHETLAPVVIGSSRIEENIYRQIEAGNQSQLLVMYLAGVLVFVVLFLIKLYKIYRLVKQHPVVRQNGYKIVLLPGRGEVFSFFGYIFMDKELYQRQNLGIVAHEQVHLQEKHWLDLLFFEILKMLFWFNPLVWVYQKEISMLHEYIADSKAVKKQPASAYFEAILQETFGVHKVSFVNSFYQPHLLKNRIMMLKRKKSTRLSLLKYVAFVVIVVGLSMLVDACKNQENSENIILKEELLKLKPEDVKSINIQKNPTKLIITKNTGETVVYYPENDDETVAVFESKMNNAEVSETEIPFQKIDNPPLYKGCEGLQGDEAKDCFSKKIREFVAKNFNKDLADSLGLKGERVKILTMFTFDKQGKVTNIKARSKYKELEKEAKRVISLLPQVEPGKVDGKPVKVTYTLPIIFKIEE